MSKNPIINALSAVAYILLVVAVMQSIMLTQGNKPDTFLAPITVLSMLTLSVSVMAYLFFYQPLQLYIDGQKKVAVNLFVRTVGVFAIFTLLVLVVLFSGVV